MDSRAMRRWLERISRSRCMEEEWTLSERTQRERVPEIVAEVEAFCRSLNKEWGRK